MKRFQKAAIAVILSILLSQSTSGYQPRPIEPLPQSAFLPVQSYEPSLAPIVEPAASIPRPTSRPVTSVPEVEPDVIIDVPAVSGNGLTGTASYYCNADASRGPLSRCHKDYPDGQGSYYAAIRKDLNSALRGKTVNVCVGDKCLPVKIIDCNCGDHPNLIDLYGDAFAYFYPLTKGAFKVTVSW